MKIPTNILKPGILKRLSYLKCYFEIVTALYQNEKPEIFFNYFRETS